MRTDAVIAVFGSAKALADCLGVSKSAISQWGDEIPALREYQLREKRPSIERELAAIQTPKREAA